jgi:hypothetical protein
MAIAPMAQINDKDEIQGSFDSALRARMTAVWS